MMRYRTDGGKGTGLGLSMTDDIIVKQHGGRIDVESEPGVFTEIIVTLPTRAKVSLKSEWLAVQRSLRSHTSAVAVS